MGWRDKGKDIIIDESIKPPCHPLRILIYYICLLIVYPPLGYSIINKNDKITIIRPQRVPCLFERLTQKPLS